MINKYLIIPLIVFVSLCGGEEVDVTENIETVESTVNSSVEQPTKDLITAVLDDDLDLSLIHI